MIYISSQNHMACSCLFENLWEKLKFESVIEFYIDDFWVYVDLLIPNEYLQICLSCRGNSAIAVSGQCYFTIPFAKP